MTKLGELVKKRFKRLLGPVLSPLARVFGPPKDAVSVLGKCNPGRMASSIAYYGAFSLAPLLVIAISIASTVYGKDASEGLILDQLSSIVGEETARFIQSLLAHLYTSESLTFATVVAVVFLVWASTGIIGSLRGALNDIWGVKGRGRGNAVLGFIFGKLVDAGIVLAAALIFLASMAANAAVGNFADRLARALPLPGWLLQLVGILLALLMTALFLSLIFLVLPNIRVRFIYLLAGASFTAVFFELGTYFIGRYIGTTAPGSAFGAAGSLIVIMVWLNYTAYIILFGAALTRVYSERGEAKRQAKDLASASAASSVPDSTSTSSPVEAQDPGQGK